MTLAAVLATVPVRRDPEPRPMPPLTYLRALELHVDALSAERAISACCGGAWHRFAHMCDRCRVRRTESRILHAGVAQIRGQYR
jgi:hypothetical protein